MTFNEIAVCGGILGGVIFWLTCSWATDDLPKFIWLRSLWHWYRVTDIKESNQYWANDLTGDRICHVPRKVILPIDYAWLEEASGKAFVVGPNGVKNELLTRKEEADL